MGYGSVNVGSFGVNEINVETNTDIVGIIKGNGSNILKAISGVDYIPPSGGSMTGELIGQSNTNYTVAQFRNIIAVPESEDPGVGSPLENGTLLIVYSV